MPHGVTVDGNRNIWVTDVGAHQVGILPSFFIEFLRYMLDLLYCNIIFSVVS